MKKRGTRKKTIPHPASCFVLSALLKKLQVLCLQDEKMQKSQEKKTSRVFTNVLFPISRFVLLKTIDAGLLHHFLAAVSPLTDTTHSFSSRLRWTSLIFALACSHQTSYALEVAPVLHVSSRRFFTTAQTKLEFLKEKKKNETR